ncbi:hypothetical protein OESDEN_12360 [Oesophagostomum dentatum]|nr:hypothetical protein OESDEN_12360 [Oesophagostomum dentatum]
MWSVRQVQYLSLARLHASYVTSPGAHFGPAFLPWHREFVKRLEIALRQVDPDVALPYWDSTLDAGLDDPTTSVMFSEELMGTTDSSGTVTTGLFAYWQAHLNLFEVL